MVVDCDAFDCDRPGATLGEAARAGALLDTATFGDLDGALAGVRIGDIADVLDGYTAADFRDALAGFSLADFTTFDDLTLGELTALHDHLDLGDLGAALSGIRLGDIADRIEGFTAADVLAALDGLTLDDFTTFDDLTLGELTGIHQYLELGDLFGAVDGIRLGDLIGIIADGAGGTYDEADLRAALEGAVGADAVLGELGPDFDDLTLGELGTYGGTTLGELLVAIQEFDPDALDGITLGDLLLALLARTQYPWERLDLNRVTAQALDGADDGLPVSVAFQALDFLGGTRRIRVEVRPPFGSSVVPGSARLSGFADAAPDPEVVDGTLVWVFDALAPAVLHTLTFQLEPTMQIGTSQVEATVTLLESDSRDTDVADITVLEATEPNDTIATATPLVPDTIQLSHVSSSDDIDVYSFTVAEPGRRVSAILSNLDADLDVVLYSPRASSASIQEPSDRSIIPVEDEGASAIPGSTEVAPEPVDDLDAPQDLGDLAINQASINRGTRDERIETGPLHRTGTYYLVVSGYNGASNRQPYALRLKELAAPARPACTARSVTPGPQLGTLPAALPEGTDTVFLVNRSRLEGLYGAAGADQVIAALDGLVAYVNDPAHDDLGVTAAVLGVDGDAQVRAAYSAWDASPCLPETANGVVAELVRVLDGYRDAGTTLRHVVVVGGDDLIPSARVPDRTEIANESGYAQTFSDGNNALFATFATSHVLTDDAYGDLDPYGFGDRVLFVSDTSVGRLVETPAEIADQATDFIAAEGRLAVGTGLVTGYDFLTDGAQSVVDALEPTVTGAVDRSLISDVWTRQDLEDAINGLEPDLASINAHFDHFRALPGESNSTGDESDLFTAAAVRGTLAGDLAGAVVFSMGCHGGLSASDLLVAGDRSLDFAQAIAGQGGVFVGNTGYGYGDTEIVALSERLMTLFAGRLDGALSVGEALLYAKAEYAADLTAYGVYDEKALMEATLYGLPFYRLDVADPPPVPPLPAPPTVSPDPTGIDTTTIAVTPIHEPRTSDDGERYHVAVDPETGDEGATAVHDRPVQPRVDETFTAPAGAEAHDALVVGLVTTDEHGVEPHDLQPIVDDGDERVDAAANAVFPSAPVRVNPQLTPAGEAYTLSATTGYFRTTATDGTGVQRLMDELTVTPYFVPESESDFVRPTFRSVEASVTDGVLSFAVDVDDAGDPSRVRRVYVLAVEDPEPGVSTTWRPLDLVQHPGTGRWTGSLVVTGEEIEYLVQAVDAAGNVGITTNKALNFRDATLPLDPPAGDLDVAVVGTEGNAGWYTSAVTVTVTGGRSVTYEILGSTAEQPYTEPFTIAEDGPHTVVVRSADGRRVTRTVSIDTAGPEARISAPLDGAVLGIGTGVRAAFACLDPGSGAVSCTATLDGEPIAAGDDVTLEPGDHTLVVATGPDVAGNAARTATQTTTFHVVPAPAITSIELPDGVPEAGEPTTVTATYTADPLGSPHVAVFSWDDGTTTTCRSDGPTAECSISEPDASGNGTATATHTYDAVVERTIAATVANRFGAADARQVTLNRTTAITATPVVLDLSLFGGITIETGSVSAALTDADGEPLVGKTVRFTAGNGSVLCTATTDGTGEARCDDPSFTLTAILSGHYTARFLGDARYQGISTTAPLVSLQ